MNANGNSSEPVSGKVLWSGLLLPGVVWLLHFIGIWAIAEYGCLASGFPHVEFLGVMGLAWAVVVLTLILLGISVSLGMLSVRGVRRLETASMDTFKEADLYMARAGVYSALAFSLIILVEFIPTLYYLEGC